jgi:hypothetical protein
MRNYGPGTFATLRINSLIDLDGLIGEHVTGETPETHWEDSNSLFRFDTEEEASEAIRNPYYQLFVPDVDWTDAQILRVQHYRPYSSDISAAWEVVEQLSEARPLQLRREQQQWLAAFGTAEPVSAPSAAIAICLAALRIRGIEVDLDASAAA